MTRRALIAVAVTLLVATSGCLGLFGGGDGGGSGETTTATTTTTTATTTTTPTTADPGPGDTETESPLGDQAQVHRKELRAAGSFTSTITLNVTQGSRSQHARIVYRIDADDDRYLSEISLTQGDTTLEGDTYTAGKTTYTRRSTGDRVRYDSDTTPYEGQIQPVSVEDAMGGPRFGVELGAYDLQRDGTGTFQGQEMTRYTATGVDAFDTEPPQGVEDLTDFRITVLVDDRGVVRRIAMHLEGTTPEGEQFVQDATIEITDVGSTNVTEPDWIDQAKQNDE